MVKELSRYAALCNMDKTLVTIACDTVCEEDNEIGIPLIGYCYDDTTAFSDTCIPAPIFDYFRSRVMPFRKSPTISGNAVHSLTEIACSDYITEPEIKSMSTSYKASRRRILYASNIIGGD